MRGTAATLNQSGLGYVAGKTGTTSNYRDAWFIGYTPDLLTAVWVGFDDGTPLRMSSGEAAVPIWATYMTRAPHSHADILPPQGVSMVEVEAMTGRVWQPGCGPSVVEAYLSGTEPRDPCGGYFDGSQMLGIYEEPPMMTDSMAMQMMPYDTSALNHEIVKDPDEANITQDTSVSFDTVGVARPIVDSTRIREERRRSQPRQPLPPIIPPPARADTPVTRSPSPRPTPPQNPPQDSSRKDSLAIR